MGNEKSSVSNINNEVRETMIRTIGIFLVVYGALCLIPSSFGITFGTPFYYMAGILSYLLFAFLIFTGLFMIIKKRRIRKLKRKYIISLTVFLLFVLSLVSINKNLTLNQLFAITNEDYVSCKTNGFCFALKGGLIGNFVFALFNTIFGGIIYPIVISSLAICLILFATFYPTVKKISLRRKDARKAKEEKKAKKEVIKHEEVKEIEDPVEESEQTLEDSVDSTTIHISGENFRYEKPKETKTYKIEKILSEFDDEIYPESYKSRTRKAVARANHEISIEEYSYSPYMENKEETPEQTDIQPEETAEPEVAVSEVSPSEEVKISEPINKIDDLKERISKLSDEEYELLFGRKKEEPTVSEEKKDEVTINPLASEEPEKEESKEDDIVVSVANVSYDELKNSMADETPEEKEAAGPEAEVKEEPVRDNSNDMFIRSENSNVFTLNIKEDFSKETVSESEKEEAVEETTVAETITKEAKPEVKKEEVKPVVDLNTVEYELPPLYLLKDAVNDDTNQKNEQIAMEKAGILMEKMKELNVQATINSFVVGPAVTRFEIKLAPGIRVNAFTNLQEDFKLALGVNSIRIESPIPGKPSTIGIEVPNDLRAMVSMKEVIASMPNKKSKLYVPVGKDVSGKPLSFPIVDMPHCLISGATNSGKSVCANAIIMSMLLNYRPNEVRFIMVDPKHVEMAPYADIPHLLCPIITESTKAFVALDKLCIEMDKRFTVYSQVNVKNIATYNELMESQNKVKMSYIVVVVDEFAELMLGKNSDAVEERIQKLSQLGRACGIHLILLTQRPDTNVISGTIKNNLPCRMTFRLSSFADSRTVIDVGGAEKLLNRGDMLLLTPDYTGLRRVQGVFVSDEEINNVVSFCKKQVGPHYEEEFLDLRTDEEKKEQEKKIIEESEEKAGAKVDETYLAVKDYVIHQEHVSTNNLQVVFKFNYLKAFNYINQLEAEGIIGPSNGTKPREVLANKKEKEELEVESEEIDE